MSLGRQARLRSVDEIEPAGGAHRPRVAENCTDQYEDDKLQPADPTAVIPWADALDQLATVDTYWFATVRPDGRPHVRPVLAVWLDGVLHTTTNERARKFLNLASNRQVSVSASTAGIDFVVEGTASVVTDPGTLDRLAHAYRSKYGWPVTVAGTTFVAPYGAPTAGAPPYQPVGVTPHTVYGFGTDDRFATCSTRWRFGAATARAGRTHGGTSASATGS